MCTRQCDGLSTCKIPQCHQPPPGPKRRALSDVALPSDFQRTLLTAKTAQQAILAKHGDRGPTQQAIQDGACDDGDNIDYGNIDYGALLATPLQPINDDQPQVLGPLDNAVAPAVPAVAGPVPVATASPAPVAPAVAVPVAAPAAVPDVSPAAIQLRMMEAMVALQQGQAALLQMIKSADPVQQTARQNRKRTRPPGQLELVEHLKERMQKERRGYAGLLPQGTGGGHVRIPASSAPPRAAAAMQRVAREARTDPEVRHDAFDDGDIVMIDSSE